MNEAHKIFYEAPDYAAQDDWLHVGICEGKSVLHVNGELYEVPGLSWSGGMVITKRQADELLSAGHIRPLQ